MDVYIAFTDKEKIKIDEWKKSLPKGKRSYGIYFISTDERNEDNKLLFKAYFRSSDGHKLFITKKAAFH